MNSQLCRTEGSCDSREQLVTIGIVVLAAADNLECPGVGPG